MTLLNNINGSLADRFASIEDLNLELIEAMGDPVEVFPGIAIVGYCEDNMIISEELFYEDLASLVRFISYYELIDHMVILNPQDKDTVLKNGGRNLITYPKQDLYVYTFSQDAIMANQMIKYYTFVFEMGTGEKK